MKRGQSEKGWVKLPWVCIPCAVSRDVTVKNFAEVGLVPVERKSCCQLRSLFSLLLLSFGKDNVALTSKKYLKRDNSRTAL